MGTSPFSPKGASFVGGDQRTPLRDALSACGQFGPNQTAGRFFPMACVSLEVTQRCNLDCTLCYLSERAEMAHDVPLDILFDRIEMVARHYGAGTSIQISGGDPTLRPLPDLVAICAKIRTLGMRSCLMTNGILATREMLESLSRAGLDDVAFHVDLTQERTGFPTEESLNSVRSAYIERAKGLGVRILFNTTVFDGNIGELPSVARYFRDRAADLALVSFQMQADTGRGVAGARSAAITKDSVTQALASGFEADFPYQNIQIGHRDCNRYTVLLVAGQKASSIFGDRNLVADIFRAFDETKGDVAPYTAIPRATLRSVVRRPILALRTLAHGAGLLWQMRGGLVQSRGKVSRLSVLVHNFMDAEELIAERCASCVFMVMTADGPMSMCAHNAERDMRLFSPASIHTGDSQRWWSAATGKFTDRPDGQLPDVVSIKRMKGRQRRAALAARRGPPGQ